MSDVCGDACGDVFDMLFHTLTVSNLFSPAKFSANSNVTHIDIYLYMYMYMNVYIYIHIYRCLQCANTYIYISLWVTLLFVEKF